VVAVSLLTDLTLQAWPHLAIQGAADVLSPLFVKGLAYTPLKGAFA
jgi:hypothetical protein